MSIEPNKDWRKKSMTWGKRVLLVVLIMTAAMYAVLSLAQRSKDAIRQGLEDYLEQASGENAEITDVISVMLVPDVTFRLKGIALRDAETRKTSLVRAEKVYISQPLLRLMAGSNWYHGFEVQGLETASGYFLPKKLSLDFAGISDPSGGQDTPNFLMEGVYNGQPLLVTAEMTRKERKKAPLYGFSDIFAVTLKLGLIEGHGFYVREWSNIEIKDVILSRADKSAKFTVQKFGWEPLKGDVSGYLNERAFTGTFSQKNGKDVLVIHTEEDTDENTKFFRDFAAGILKDFGLNEENASFSIEVENPEELSKE